MKRRPKHPFQADNASAPATDANAILLIKIWLVGISPTEWRRVLVSTTFTLRELHGVIQVVMAGKAFTSTIFIYARRAMARGEWRHRRRMWRWHRGGSARVLVSPTSTT